MNPAPDDRLLGEYRLAQLIAENSLSRTWLAEQVSVSRRVLVDELLDESRRDSFLADVRAKASVDHPLIGSVYEAVAEPDLCFFAHELLPGMTLEERKNLSQPLVPARLSHVLRRVADANLQHEALSHATSLIGLDSIHLDEHGVIRVENLAVAGPRTGEQSVRDIVHLGTSLPALVSAGLPGATRLLTLLSWMRGDGLDAPISWTQVREFCEQIEHQLAEPLPPAPATQIVGQSRGKKLPLGLITAATVLAIAAIAALAINMRPPAHAAPPRTRLPDAVLVPDGKYPTPDGTEETLHAFSISANEVTIGQYAEFLDTLQVLAKDNHERTFDVENQPAEKTSHVPDDWTALLAAAKSNGTWKGQSVTLDSPVTGVDWWDAAAYVEWKQAHLPTQEEWFAAMTKDVKVPASLTPGAFAPVTAETTDRTPNGLIGMAGSVCEWTRRPAPNPANPLGERLWVIIGGSYLKPGSNALSREWTPNRNLRRPDLGFRIVSDAK
ncbi:MAG: SUMF1/EgtB/PvdO family nonheme iron enzyme [Luteolibacter sp.]